MDIWETIRIRCVRDKEPYKRVARELGISKNTVKKYVQANTPPLQRAPAGRSAHMARFESHVDDLLRDTPKITASRIAQIIRERAPQHLSKPTPVPEDKPPPQIPLVPMAQHTLSANVAFCTYGPAGFQLVLIDQRQAPVAQVGDTPINTNFEIGRFQLTPAALRGLETSIIAAVQNFKNVNGADLPTRDQMFARDQKTALERSLPQFKAAEPPTPDK